MRWVELDQDDVTEHGSGGVEMTVAARLKDAGECRVHVATVQPGGVLGRHPTRLWQLFFVMSGSGWISGHDGERSEIQAGQAVMWAPGELHESGSERGMSVVITQASVPLPLGSEAA